MSMIVFGRFAWRTITKLSFCARKFQCYSLSIIISLSLLNEISIMFDGILSKSTMLTSISLILTKKVVL